jgi:hypothetical protein
LRMGARRCCSTPSLPVMVQGACRRSRFLGGRAMALLRYARISGL